MFLMRLECTFLPKSLVLSPAIEGVQVCVIQMFTVGMCLQICQLFACEVFCTGQGS